MNFNYSIQIAQIFCADLYFTRLKELLPMVCPQVPP